MKILDGDVWKRRGISLLWGGETLSSIVAPDRVLTIREFFASIGHWPAELPSRDGNTMVVGGLEGCMDLLEPADAETWLETDFRPAILAFQAEYGLEAGLVFWLPTGKARVRMNKATEAYSWLCAAPFVERQLDLGRILWSGAEADVGRIIDPSTSNPDPDGPAWIGLHHPRLS